MKILENAVKIIFMIVAGIVLLLFILFGFLISTLGYEVSTKDRSESPDGKYTLLLQSVGSPIFFGPANGQLVLKEGRKKIAVHKFLISPENI